MAKFKVGDRVKVSKSSKFSEQISFGIGTIKKLHTGGTISYKYNVIFDNGEDRNYDDIDLIFSKITDWRKLFKEE